MEDLLNKIFLINKKKYQLAWYTVELDGIYLYLINRDDYNEILFAKFISENEIEEVEDSQKIGYIIGMMSKEISKIAL